MNTCLVVFWLQDISATAVTPEPSLCCPNCVVGMGNLNLSVTVADLQATMSACLRTVRVFDVSANGVLNNLTLMATFLSDFSVFLPTGVLDVAGNDHIPLLEMQQSPLTCSFQTSMASRAVPNNIIGNGTKFFLDLPALVYACSCSPGYQVDGGGTCYLYWSPARIAAVVIGCTLATIVALLYVAVPWYRRRQRRFASSLELQRLLLNEADSELVHLKQTWQLQWSDITIGDTIAHGAFGEVYRATWMGNAVACKQLKQVLEEFESESFAAEAAAMSGLRHPNIVTFFGAGVDDDGRGFLVTELMARGSLRHALKDTDNYPLLSWESRLRFATDVVAGMLFLHSRQPPMLHRDLKSENVLLDEHWVAKVSDFGTLRTITGSGTREESEELKIDGSAVSSRTDPSLLLTATNCEPLPASVVPCLATPLSHTCTCVYMQCNNYGIEVHPIVMHSMPLLQRSDDFLPVSDDTRRLASYCLNRLGIYYFATR